MAVFYRHYIRPLTLECAAIFLHNLDPSLQVGKLSQTEQLRLIRVLYRFQLYCNLFGPGPLGNRQIPHSLDELVVLACFFCIYKPWEIEEFDFLFIIIEAKYDVVSNAIRWDVHRDNPEFSDWDRSYTPGGTFGLDKDYELLSSCYFRHSATPQHVSCARKVELTALHFSPFRLCKGRHCLPWRLTAFVQDIASKRPSGAG